MDKYIAIIPAAGQGKRMGAGMNKQFLHVAGEPIIVHTLRFFEEDDLCEEVVLVVNKEERETMLELVKTFRLQKVQAIVNGGRERQQSVYNGIVYVSEKKKDGIVLIHDGARPFVTKTMVEALVKKVLQSEAATVAVPVKDTIKRVENNKVVETLKRESLWAIQTPQAFKLSLIKKAHEQAEEEGVLGTDDASLVERLGVSVCITEGDYRNIKLTTPEDLIFAEAIMQERMRDE